MSVIIKRSSKIPTNVNETYFTTIDYQKEELQFMKEKKNMLNIIIN